MYKLSTTTVKNILRSPAAKSSFTGTGSYALSARSATLASRCVHDAREDVDVEEVDRVWSSLRERDAPGRNTLNVPD
eukprot:6327336-Pyramimonas_sp.AAC.1